MKSLQRKPASKKSKVWILFLLIFQTSGSSDLNFFAKNETTHIEIIEDIVSNCFGDLKTIFINSCDDGNLIGLLTALHNYTLLTNCDKNISNKLTTYRKIDLLIIIASTTDTPTLFFDNNFEFNSMITVQKVLITFEDPKDCQEKKIRVFESMWLSDVNSGYVICLENSDLSDGNYKIYTYNPYIDYAPPLWEKMKSNKSIVNNKKTIYVYAQDYLTDKICQNFDFDRTKKLDGYYIKTATNDKSITLMDQHKANSSGLVLKDSVHVKVLTAIAKTLNVFLNLRHLPESNNNESKLSVLENWFLTKKVDMLASEVILTVSVELKSSIAEQSYPLKHSSDVIVTHNRGLATPLEKMYDYYGNLIILSTIIISLITFTWIYFIKGKKMKKNNKLSFAAFECLRLIINNSLYTPMHKPAIRVFFSVVFLYFLIIQATFSGHLAAFLTKPVYRKNVECLDDLLDPRYSKIYARKAMKDYITDSSLLEKMIFSDENCRNFIENSTSNACIEVDLNMYNAIYSYDLHVAKNPLLNRYTGFLYRSGWSLTSRINNIIMYLAQSGILFKWYKIFLHPINKNLQRKIEELTTGNYYRPLIYHDLKFVFIFLGFGLFGAFFCFTIEVIIHQLKVWFGKIKRYRRRNFCSIVIPTGYVVCKSRRIVNCLHR